MHLAIWGQSCFLHCSRTNSLFTIRDGECGGWPPLTSPQLLSAYWGGRSWWFPNNWLCSIVSDSVQPHRRQPTRLHHPWDSPGKNTGVGCHFLLQCMQVKSESEVSQSCPTPSNPMDCSLPGSSVHGIFQARVLEWGAIAFSLENAQSSLVQSLNPVWLFATPWITAHQASLSITNSCRSQTHVHQVSDAIQPSHPLSSPSPPAPNPPPASGSFPMSQLFAWGGQSTGVSASALVLPMNTQDWSPLGWTGWISLQSKGLSRVFSNTTVQKHQFFGAQLPSQSNSHIHTWSLEKP